MTSYGLASIIFVITTIMAIVNAGIYLMDTSEIGCGIYAVFNLLMAAIALRFYRQGKEIQKLNEDMDALKGKKCRDTTTKK